MFGALQNPVSLDQTLNGFDVLGPMQALALQQAQQLHSQTQAATQQASQAQQAYGQAAAAPPPELSPAQQFLPSLIGNIASVLGATPAYAEQAQQRQEQTRAGLLKQRSDNLLRLRDIYSQKADEAQKAGNLEEEQKFRTQTDLADKRFAVAKSNADRAHDTEMEAARAKSAQDLEKLRQKGDLAVVNAKLKQTAAQTAGESNQEVEGYITKLNNGEINTTDVPVKQGMRDTVISEMNKRGLKVMPGTVRKALNEIGAAKDSIAKLKDISQRVNDVHNGPAALIQGPLKWGSAVLNLNLDAGDLETLRAGIAGSLARAVQSERGVLTNQDRAYALKLLPAFGDSSERAAHKIQMLEDFVNEKEQRAIRTYTTANAGITPAGAKNGGVQKWGRDANGHPVRIQ